MSVFGGRMEKNEVGADNVLWSIARLKDERSYVEPSAMSESPVIGSAGVSGENREPLKRVLGVAFRSIHC